MLDCMIDMKPTCKRPAAPARALDALDCRNDAELLALEQHVLGYLVREKGQTLRVKPSPKAHAFVKGMPNVTDSER